MRKTQVALAALALMASTAALAEVTLYGGLDVGVANTNSGTVWAAGGNNGISLIGIRATEDLGGGLKLTGVAEGGFGLGTGGPANGGTFIATPGADQSSGLGLFNRETKITLGTDEASVTAGMQISPFIVATLTGADNGVGGNGVFVPAIGRLTGGNLGNVTGAVTAGGFFVPEALSANVNLNGVSVSVLTRAAAGGNKQSYTAASVSTSVAGINLAYGYQSFGTIAAADNYFDGTIRNSSGVTNHVLAANTEIAGIRLNAAYGSTKGGTDTAGDPYKGSGYLFGASTNLVGALSGGVTYATSTTNDQGAQTSVSLKYAMSKATYLYGTYTSFSKDFQTATDAHMLGNFSGIGNKAAMVGINTSF